MGKKCDSEKIEFLKTKAQRTREQVGDEGLHEYLSNEMACKWAKLSAAPAKGVSEEVERIDKEIKTFRETVIRLSEREWM